MNTYPPPIDENITEEQYLVREPQAEYKSEYRNGRKVAMSGASHAHSLITVNLLGELRQMLKAKPCEVHSSDMRIKVAKAHFYTYPDVSIVCGPPQFDPRDRYALINPSVIIEVLSPSTEAYDRGEKFGYYQKLDSLQEYILIRQDRLHVECRRLTGSGWVTQELDSLEDILEIPTAGCRVPLLEIYSKVDLG